MSVPAFLDLSEQDQILELRSFLKGKGAEISEEASPDGIVTDLKQIVQATDVCWTENVTDLEVEGGFNSVICLMHLLPLEHTEQLVPNLCEKLGKAVAGDSKKNAIKLCLLNNLFQGLPDSSPSRYDVYLSMVQVAGQAELMSTLEPNLEQIKTWITLWDISTQQVQNLLRNIYEGHQECKQSDKATKIMIELLGTYTEENASQAKSDAHKCIVTCLADPSTYLMDYLLTLKPVKFLEGEPIHDLLTIFVSGKLTQYMTFYNTNKEFINSIGLSHEQNMQKMRLLTFMQMAETRKELEFGTIQQEMKLEPDEVEAFIIDVVRTKSVRAKIDQKSKTVIISSTTHRTFGKQQWQLLKESLEGWQQNLTQVLGSLQNVVIPR